jgi:hypothetical protein
MQIIQQLEDNGEKLKQMIDGPDDVRALTGGYK